MLLEVSPEIYRCHIEPITWHGGALFFGKDIKVKNRALGDMKELVHFELVLTSWMRSSHGSKGISFRFVVSAEASSTALFRFVSPNESPLSSADSYITD